MNIKKHIPNALTCCNLLCGCIGIVAVFNGNLLLAPYLVWLAAIFDFFDGFAARLLNVSSPIGGELDSLADNVTFGLLPASIIYAMLQEAGLPAWVPYLAFVIAVFSALRLAKFNVDTRQAEHFIGLPTPANALFFSSFPLILAKSDLPLAFIAEPWFLLGTSFIFSFLLVAELPLFALKFKSFRWQDNKLKYIFLIASVVLIILFKFVAIPLVIILYILVSLFNRKQ
ncbi:CDP-diacylglycerol--serine O-phosphatidyltransferase [Nafulsella turpanensis]|uniref:CDP-diacylglycerol--serine O-phosphatidyltransferase n=1 Tax=Nafulsella turpanensis TaxID=1265690 RepID=UPI00034D1166|nr:CDP-diacylglycerol--serine O-phosphatidyltransferase [Nafulsella turpanensis]